MPITQKAKTTYLAEQKEELVLCFGCYQCGRGKVEDERFLVSYEGFEKYWFDSVPYEARRFVFKYTDPRGSDVPVAKLPRMKKTTLKTIDDALARCVILCRSCADPRRTRKEMTQCPTPTTNNSLPSS